MQAVPTDRPGQADWGEFEDPEVWEEGETPASSVFFDYWADVGTDVWDRFLEMEGPEWDVLQERTVSELMTRVLCTLTPETEVHEAADDMIRARVHRLLVTRDLVLVGIVTATDILRAVAERRALKAPNCRTQPETPNMTSEERAMDELEDQVEELGEQLAHVSQELAEVGARLARLEVREEALESPAAAGDEPVGDLL